MTFSQEASSLWAKTNPKQELCEHMYNTAHNAKVLWRYWLSRGIADDCMHSIANAEQLFVFLAASHDIGKATPVFQLNPRAPESFRESVLLSSLPEPQRAFNAHDRQKAKHAVASNIILLNLGVHESVALVAGGHHGKPPVLKRDAYKSFESAFGLKSKPWQDVQMEFFCYALKLSRMSKEEISAITLTLPQQMLMMGLLILSDWMASSNTEVELPERWEPLPLGTYKEMFRHHFRFSANKMQAQAMETAQHIQQPGIFIIEAPMGCGKTEAALAVAEIFAMKSKRTGVYFALPSRATADGIFQRFLDWIVAVSPNEPHAFVLAHGKAKRNHRYKKLSMANCAGTGDDDTPSVFVHEWLSGKKLQMLADFGVGTIDQLLMGALKHKFLALRHLGFAGKVIIVDEVHAYDAYMDSYLCRMLQWLAAYKVPVIVLSATLPAGIRQQLVAAYVDNIDTERSTSGWDTCENYPLITYSDGGSVRQRAVPPITKHSVTVNVLSDKDCFAQEVAEYESIANVLRNMLADGGVAGIIVNTVMRARELAKTLGTLFGEDALFLLHSRFIAQDRADLENELMQKIGKDGERPQKLIVVGTQIMEQSLDIDFDILFTDCCPMDLLLQRIGRLQRHQRKRPPLLQEPKCIVMHTYNLEEGAVAVYGAYHLLCTQYLLPQQIVLPDDIAPLVHAAYGEDIPVPEEEKAAFHKAKEENDNQKNKKQTNAETFQLGSLQTYKKTLAGWLDYGDTGKETEGEASVRDGDAAIEVILLQKIGRQLHLLPWVEKGDRLPENVPPEDDVAYKLSGCSLALPYVFSAKWMQGNTIDALEQCKNQEIPSAWEESHWLRGVLYLVLDENLQTELCGKTVFYDRKLGLFEGGSVVGKSI